MLGWQWAQAYDALPPGGAFIALDCIIDDARRSNVWGLAMSLDMMMEFETEGAADYTFEVGTTGARGVGQGSRGRAQPAPYTVCAAHSSDLISGMRRPAQLRAMGACILCQGSMDAAGQRQRLQMVQTAGWMAVMPVCD